MKLKNLVQTMTLSILASAMLVGCGGGSDSTAPVDDTQTGTFIDAPVKGLYFKTATQQGYTNDSGEFSYKAGETVEFKLGNLSLGTVSAGALITPYTMAEVATGTNDNKATNIALLLQNLDSNRTNTTMLDVSKLKDMNLSDFNLSVTSATFEALLANKLTAGTFDIFINSFDKALLDTPTVKSRMDTYVNEQILSKLSVNNIIGKDYVSVRYSQLLGATKEDLTLKFTTSDKTISTYEGINGEATYKTIDGILEMMFDDGSKDYNKILSISANFVSICSGDTLEEAKSCYVPDAYWVAPSSVDTFIATKESEKILKEKTLVTDFSEIKNKLFYMPSVWKSENVYNYNIDAFKIEDNNTVYAGYIGASDYQGDESTYQLFYHTWLQNGVASFSNGNLTITGDRWDFEGNYNSYNEMTTVYKYALADKSFLLSDFATVFDETSWQIFENDTITFTTGNMYCTMFDERCWLDLDAVKTFNDRLKESNKLVQSN